MKPLQQCKVDKDEVKEVHGKERRGQGKEEEEVTVETNKCTSHGGANIDPGAGGTLVSMAMINGWGENSWNHGAR
jgi:hypothetical protein